MGQTWGMYYRADRSETGLCTRTETGSLRTARKSNPRPSVKKVLCSALVYTPLIGLHRTNSPATRLQQAVTDCHESTQHALPYTPVWGRIRSISALIHSATGGIGRDFATVSFRE